MDEQTLTEKIEALPRHWDIGRITAQLGLSERDTMIALLNRYQTVNGVAARFNGSSNTIAYHIHRQGLGFTRVWRRMQPGERTTKRRFLTTAEEEKL